MKVYNRKKPSRKKKDNILILCAGQTEKIYFTKLRNRKKLNNVTVDIYPSNHGDARSVVREAIKKKDLYSQIWCVFDYDNDAHFDEAIDLAKSEGLNYAFSNMAFEYWFLLHRKNVSTCMSVATLEKSLEREFGIAKYDKSLRCVENLCDRLMSINLENIEIRADLIYQQHEHNSGKNPSNWCSCTNVHKLTEKLRKWQEATK